ncbi:MAG: type transport system permease protein [Archaeoglobaceae archaeon]|nr:type transport system permease protein [Archaeoglobaceae archaeon]
MSEIQGIYVLWLRDVKKFFRIKSRVIGSLGMPVFFLIFLSIGFRRASIPSLPEGISYGDFIVPGIVAMILLFSGTFSGVSVVWDRQFGFLREIMVSPVSRTAIALGRTLGGATTALLQGLMLLILSTFIGFSLPLTTMPLAIFSMFLIAMAFTGLGILFSVFMRDVHGFQIIMNFFVFPIFLISGTLFPISEFPEPVAMISKLNPLTYGVDAMRYATLGFSEIDPVTDFAVLLLSTFCILLTASFLFSRTEVE